MLARRVAQLAIVWLALFAHSAFAFFDPPWITPANLIDGETVSVNIHGGICDAFVEMEGYPQITIDGNAIRILLYGVHYDPGDELCIFPTWTAAREIGAFPAGSYTLTVDMLYRHAVFGPVVLNIGTALFTVAARQQSTPLPAISPFGALALAALVASAAVWGMRTRAPNGTRRVA